LAIVQKQVEPHLTTTTLLRDPIRECFLTVTPQPGESSQSLFQRTADAIRRLGGEVVSIEALGMKAADRKHGDRFAPMSWIENDGVGLCGVHAWVISGTAVHRLRCDGRIVGSSFEDSCARYCRLAGLLPTEASAEPGAQTSEILGQMDAVLKDGRMQFSNIIRTWFYNDRILAWYPQFNVARTQFFQEKRVFDGLLPASTGISGRNAKAAALTAGVMAVAFKSAGASVSVVPSPLQSSATKYGSSFSRAVELSLPDHRRLYISGTASIDQTGKTVFLGDTARQIGKTMEVVEAILSSREMGWPDVSRAIVYFKHAADAPLFNACRTARGIPALPAVITESDVCRDDLLFEIELDAIKAR
jgi:enamine deaminase RidA (YjgF/YER057c/UK114 family)